ncbi:MAG: PspC domain-containing protein [Gemella sp.]|nr:PspC domain-containing protein [Gemella sp.]
MDRLKKFREKAHNLAKRFKIYRIKKGAIFAGICKMIAEKFVLKTSLVRLFFVLINMFSLGLALVFYLILAWLLPKKEATEPDYIDVEFTEKKNQELKIENSRK